MPGRTSERMLVTLVITACCTLQPLAVVAQPPDDDQPATGDYFMSLEHRQKIYEQKRKSTAKALLLSVALPGLGNIYAEQYLIGGLMFISLAFSAVFISYGLTTQQTRPLVTGIVLAAGTYVGSGSIAAVGVASYNRELRRNLKVEGADVRTVWTPALTLRF